MPYKNPEDKKRNSKEYYSLHKEECIARAKKYGPAWEHTPERKQYKKDYYQTHRHEIWRRYSILKSTAKKFGRNFTLTKEDYTKLVANTCFYCGGTLPIVGSGIDRRNNKLGYVQDNCIPCCEKCNEKKGKLESLGFTCPRSVELLFESLSLEKTNANQPLS